MDSIETESYKVKTGSFEGPFGLLLSLIEEKKLFINEISLTEVTEDYLNYLKNLEKKDHSEISSFIIIAATLILIKSKSLLPNLNLTSEEESDIHNLEERLRLYELYIKLAINIKNKFGKKIIFAPTEKKRDFAVFVPDKQITKENMFSFAQSALGRAPKKTFLPKVEVKKVISIEEMIDRLTQRIEEGLKMNFKDFIGKANSKEEKVVVIIGFLAMLEMVRQGILAVAQENNFEDIIMERNHENSKISEPSPSES